MTSFNVSKGLTIKKIGFSLLQKSLQIIQCNVNFLSDIIIRKTSLVRNFVLAKQTI